MLRPGPLTLLLFAWCLLQQSTQGQNALNVLPAGEVQPLGWIRHQMHLDLTAGITGKYNLVSNAVNLQVFEQQNRPAGGFVQIPIDGRQRSWWSGEHEGYWKDSVVRMAFLVNDEEQKQRAHVWINNILAAQDEDGYIGVYSRETRFPRRGENGELWTQSRIFQAMLAYHEFTGKQHVLDAVEKAVQLTLSKYMHSTYFDTEGGQGGLSHGIGFMDTLEWLYRLTGRQVYRDGLIWLYEDYQKLPSRDGEMKLERLLDADLDWQEHTPHIMEGLHAPSILYALTKEDQYKRAANNAFEKLNRHMNPGGGVVGDESVSGRSGSAEMPAEYCTMTEAVSSLNRILAWNGDLTVGDYVERICLNAAQGARFQPVNRAVRYLTMDNQLSAEDHRHAQRFLYSAWHQAAACCTLNSGRLMPYYVEGMWYRDTEHNRLIANLFGPCRINTNMHGVPVQMTELTLFPFSDKLELLVIPDQPLRFSIVFRLPAGAGEVTIDAGGSAKVTRVQNSIEVTKTWEKNDRIVIDFDFRVKQHTDRTGDHYLKWGPLVFALPLSYKRTAVKHFSALNGQESGFCMWEIRPTDKTGWNYRIDPNTSFKLVQLSDGNAQIPWSHPPLGIQGNLVNELGSRAQVTLKPLGCAILRRTTFPTINKVNESEQ